MTLFRDKYRVESARLPGWDYSTPGYYFVTICTKDRACLFGKVINGRMHLSEIGGIVAEEWARTKQIRPEVELDAFSIMPNHVHGIIVLKNNHNLRNVSTRNDCDGDVPVETHRVGFGKNDRSNDNDADIPVETHRVGFDGDDGRGDNDAVIYVETHRVGFGKNDRSNDNDADIPVETHRDASLRGQQPPLRGQQPPRRGQQPPRREKQPLPRNNLSNIIRGFKSASTKRIHETGFSGFAWQSRFYDHIIRDDRALNRIREYIMNNPKKWGSDRNYYVYSSAYGEGVDER